MPSDFKEAENVQERPYGRRPAFPQVLSTVVEGLLHSYGLPGMLPQGRIAWRNAGDTADRTEASVGPEHRRPGSV
jgi:hypothetical protein